MDISRSPGTTPLCFFLLKKNGKQNRHSSSHLFQISPVQIPSPTSTASSSVKDACRVEKRLMLSQLWLDVARSPKVARASPAAGLPGRPTHLALWTRSQSTPPSCTHHNIARQAGLRRTVAVDLSNSQLFEQDLTCRPLLPLLCPLSHRGSHAVSSRGHLTRLLFRGVGHCPLFFFLLSPRERRERPPSILQAAIRHPQPANPQSANVATRQNKQILSILPSRHFDTPPHSPGPRPIIVNPAVASTIPLRRTAQFRPAIRLDFQSNNSPPPQLAFRRLPRSTRIPRDPMDQQHQQHP